MLNCYYGPIKNLLLLVVKLTGSSDRAYYCSKGSTSLESYRLKTLKFYMLYIAYLNS